MPTDIFTPLYKEIPFERPDIVYRRLREKNSFLLESVKGSDKTAGYSFIGIQPYLILKVKDGVVEIELNGKKTMSSRKPLPRMRELLQAYNQRPAVGLPPFQGGAVGMLTYDFV